MDAKEQRERKRVGKGRSIDVCGSCGNKRNRLKNYKMEIIVKQNQMNKKADTRVNGEHEIH